MTNQDDLDARYMAAAHAMQSGVAMWMNYDSKETDPKGLRVGINSAMVEHGALVKLLIEKGVFTNEEFMLSLIEMMEREVEGYRQRIEQRLGGKMKIDLA